MASKKSIVAELKKELAVDRIARMQSLKLRVKRDDKLCSKCIKFYDVECEGQMPPVCSASADITIREDVAALAEQGDWSDQDKDLYAINMDPVRWAKLMFNWEARWYQSSILRCNSQKMLLRAGRRIGKTNTIAVSALHHAFTTENGKVLIICPLQDQVNIVFDIIRMFINTSPAIKGSVVGDKQNPQKITFANGSFIFGITAGIRAGTKGDKMRGYDATRIYLDEADFLDRKTLNVLLAIFASHSDCGLWASSTPSGARSFFWEWSSKKELEFKEWHFRSNVSPTWTPAIELFYRETSPESTYTHEYDAEFGDAETGVYQNQYLDRCLADYSIQGWKRIREPGYRYTLGVDWNEAEHGVHLIVVEYSPKTQRMTMCLHESITAKEFTQLKAVERIINLHASWGFDAIYVDAGYGSVQIEQMHLYGHKHPASKLGQIVKGIHMQQNLIIRDPYTGQDQKKNAKHLMVDLSAARVENLQCVFPKSENMRGGLVWQMRNFKAERISRDGIPVYNTMEDHALVAWQLAILALIMEFTELTRAQFSNRVEFADIHKLYPTAEPGVNVPKIKPQRYEPISRVSPMNQKTDDFPGVVHIDNFRRPRRGLGKRVTF